MSYNFKRELGVPPADFACQTFPVTHAQTRGLRPRVSSPPPLHQNRVTITDAARKKLNSQGPPNKSNHFQLVQVFITIHFQCITSQQNLFWSKVKKLGIG